MPGSTDERAQPWQKWYASLPKEDSTTQLRLMGSNQGMGNNGNDNHNRNVYGTCTPATSAAKHQMASQLMEKDN